MYARVCWERARFDAFTRAWGVVVNMRVLEDVGETAIDLRAVARCYVQEHFPGRDVHQNIVAHLDPDYCAEVGRFYDEAVDDLHNPRVMRYYDQFKLETMAQWEALVSAGLTIRPWLEPGQPYASSRELHEQVCAASTLYIFLTRCGHGPCNEVNPNHPMTTESSVRIGAETLLHNDLFRAVHDAFGHVMSRNEFSLRGEFKATYDHLQMYSDDAAQTMISETIGQICWFYCGPHLLGPNGYPAQEREPGYVAPRDRPYPPQKILVLPEELTSGFGQLFERKLA